MNACPIGLTLDEVEDALDNDPQLIEEFGRWMRGQTMAVCEGKKYCHDCGQYRPTECAANPHGLVIYPWDLERFLMGLPVID